MAEKDETAIAEIPAGKNSTLTVENFLRIKAFILSRGLRQTYCNMFNDNPYYPFANFNVYLNPPSQLNINCDTGRSDFTAIVIQTSKGFNEYRDIRMGEKGDKLTLIQHYSTIKPDALTKEVEGFFREALEEIKNRHGHISQV